ncbi:hypothetical protein VCHENC02_2143, partial [Vibrio harveyi]
MLQLYPSLFIKLIQFLCSPFSILSGSDSYTKGDLM